MQLWVFFKIRASCLKRTQILYFSKSSNTTVWKLSTSPAFQLLIKLKDNKYEHQNIHSIKSDMTHCMYASLSISESCIIKLINHALISVYVAAGQFGALCMYSLVT